MAPLRQDISAYSLPRGNELRSIAAFFVEEGLRRQAGQFVETYLTKAREELDKQLGFPLAGREANALSVDGVNGVANLLEKLAADIPGISAVQALAADSRQWAQYTNRIQRLHSMAINLFDVTGQPIGATVFLPAYGKGNNDVKWRERWRDISLHGPKDKKRTANGDEQSLGDLAINDTMQLTLFDDANNAKTFPSEDLGPWGVLRCLYKYHPIRPESPQERNGKTWYVEMPFQDEAGTVLRLKIVFSQALHLEDWPN
jgi:hypothetical protein